jgi:eukaryotic-like serine/threonine-protein kinase
MNTQHERLKEILAAAAAQPTPAARAAYLDRACQGDATLRAEVECLLQAHDGAGDFLGQTVQVPPPADTGEGPGSEVGRYKLLEEIGEGAFGRVFMAEQTKPVQRKVALKIIKAGMDTREVIARLEAERQALALMDHPNIAKILDGGVTGGGGQGAGSGEQRAGSREAESGISDLKSQVPGTPHPASGHPLPSSDEGRGQGEGSAESEISDLKSQIHSARPYFVMELVRGLPITEYCEQKQLCTSERLELFMKVCQAVQHAHQKGIIHRDLKPTNILVTEIDGQPVPKVIDFGVAKALGQKLTQKTLATSFRQMIGTPAYMSPEQAELSGVDVDTRSDIYSLGVLLYELLTGVTPFDIHVLQEAGLDEIRRLIRETEPPKPSTRLREQTGAGNAEQGAGSGAQKGGQKSEGGGQGSGASGQKAEAGTHNSPFTIHNWKEVQGDLDWIVMKALEKDRVRRYDTAGALVQDIEHHLRHEPVRACPPSLVYRSNKFVRRHRMGVAMAVAVSLALVTGLAVALVGFAQARRERDRAEAGERKALTEATKSEQSSRLLQDTLRAVGPASLHNLALVLRERGKLAEAEILLREAVAIEQRQLDAGHASTSELFENLILVLLHQGKVAEAHRLYQEAWTVRRKVLGPKHQTTRATLSALAALSASMGLWRESLEEGQEVRAVLTNDIWLERYLAAAALLAGKPLAWQEQCARMLGRYSNTTDGGCAEVTARSCTLAPDARLDLTLVLRLAELSLTRAPSNQWCQIAKGATQYRAGHYQEAIRFLQPVSRERDALHSCTAGYYLALAHQQLGEAEEARAALRRPNLEFKECLRRLACASNLMACFDPAGVIVLRAEAERTILGRAVSPKVEAQTLPKLWASWATLRRLVQTGVKGYQDGNWPVAAAAFDDSLREPAFDWFGVTEFVALPDLWMGVAFVRAGDAGRHAELCRRLVTRLDESYSPPRHAERAAKICLLSPVLTPELLLQASNGVGLAASGVPELVPESEYRLTKGLLDYRVGRYAEAIESLHKAAATTNVYFQPYALLLRGMAAKRLGRDHEAEQDRQAAKALLPKLAAKVNQVPGDLPYLHIFELLLEEAEPLFAKPGDAPNPEAKQQRREGAK